MHVRMILAVFMILGVNAAAAQERSVEETVGDWQVLCFDDQIAQYRSCYVIRGDLSVLVSSRDYELVFIGNGAERMPGSEVSAQVDGKQVLNWREDDFYADEVFAQAIRQFRAGQKAKVTWTNKDPGEEVASEVSLVGFTKAYQRANTLISDYKPPE
jgi:Invasion associated locus B (IalB) protein